MIITTGYSNLHSPSVILTDVRHWAGNNSSTTTGLGELCRHNLVRLICVVVNGAGHAFW